MAEWRAVGATHLTVNTMGSGFQTPEAHLFALEEFAQTMKLGGSVS
jgi:hypothetical protein